jgi:uncharacterized protein (DUF111 family)
MRAAKVGYGAGSMKLEHGPNLLRVVIGTAAEGVVGRDADQVVELETNLDNVSPEVVGHACRLLREAGALDVWIVPAHMKKDRPGVVLHVLTGLDKEAAVATVIFGETGTLGIRRQTVFRHVAARGVVTVAVAGEQVRVKWGRWQGRLVSVAPEYDDAVAAAAAGGLPLKDLMQLAVAAARELLGSDHLLP